LRQLSRKSHLSAGLRLAHDRFDIHIPRYKQLHQSQAQLMRDDAKTHVRMLRCEHCLAMAIVRRLLLIEPQVQVSGILPQVSLFMDQVLSADETFSAVASVPPANE
jgi:hypothetical protein